MELRSCTQLHFIQAIRAGSVEKVPNINSHGRPALRFKKLEDIYRSEDARKRESLSTVQRHDSYADMDFNSDMVKTESPRQPLTERKTKERESNTNTSNCNSDDDEEGADGLSSDKMTLKQLKEQCKPKKRKALHSSYLSPKQNHTDRNPAGDECNLEEPLSMWTKIAKNPIDKMKRAEKRSSSPQTEVSLKSDQIPSAEDLTQCSPYLPVLRVKVEVSEVKYTECIDMTRSSDETSSFCGEQEICAFKPELESVGKISFTEEESQSCTVNEVCFDHLEHTEPNYLLPSISGEITDAENLRKTCQRSLDFPTSDDKEGHIVHPLEKSSPETNFPPKGQGSDMCNHFQSNSSTHEISRQTSGVCGVQVPDMAVDSSLCCMKPKSGGDICNLEDDIREGFPPNLERDSLSSSFCNDTTSWNSIPCSSPEIVLRSADDDLLATEKLPMMFISVDMARDLLSPHENQVEFEGGSTMKEEKQPSIYFPDDSESNSSEKDHPGDGSCKSSLSELNNDYSEQCHPPERLLSTRKAISPTSQEKLCQAMKGVELDGTIEHYKCKNKLQFAEDTRDNASPAGPDTVTEVNVIPEGLGEVTRTFVDMSPKQMIEQPKNDRKGSPPTGFRRGPNLSRSRPCVSNGTTSIQSCSERAIAFSQRQMHDIEGLATKLMHELKFMKDIVGGQAHSEASPTTPLKYDVDEVKAAVKSATKAEETTRKWLSMMTRDCNRFCKLMRLNEKGEIASGNAIHKERKKIMFADEAGGVLCHVKFIEDTIDSPDSKT